MTKIITIANPKGGVAKSTTATAFSSIAANAGFKVLLVDLDTQGHAGYLSGMFDYEGASYISELFIESPEKTLSDLAIPTKYGFDIVLSGPELLSSETWLITGDGGTQHLSYVVAADKNLAKYDFVIIDTVGARSKLQTSALLVCDELIIPVGADPLATKEIPDFVELANSLAFYRQAKGPINIKSIFFSNVSEGTNASNYAMSSFRDENPSLPISSIVIPKSTIVTEAATFQQPINVYKPKSKPAEQYSLLFNEIFSDKEI